MKPTRHQNRARMKDMSMFRIPTISLSVILPSLLAIPAVASAAPPWGSPAISGGLGGPQSPTIGQSFMTPRGPGIVTGSNGSTATTTIPGAPGQGFLVNNGNGTSTLIVPGGAPQIVMTPR